MNRVTFWRLIETTGAESRGNTELHEKLLCASLAQLGPDACLGFDRILGELMGESNDWALWGAAYLIHGGCSDDGFDYFRGWLIAQGEAVFTRAVRDPDSLADVLDSVGDEGVYEFEELLYAGWWTYEMLTGRQAPPRGLAPATMRGVHWEEDDLPRLLPRLAALRGWVAADD